MVRDPEPVNGAEIPVDSRADGEMSSAVRRFLNGVPDRLPGGLGDSPFVRKMLEQGPVPSHRFNSPLRGERTAAVLGVVLGVSFSICFLTGILSHYIQHPPGWFHYPPRPLNLYRVTQGIHVVTGIASIPLLLAKLWTVYPRFWTWPPIETIGHAIERITIVPLVAGALFELASGVANIYYWYTPMPFNFTVVHFWVGSMTIGALIIHIGAKVGTARLALRRANHVSASLRAADRGSPSTLSRRDFFVVTGATSALLAAGVAGETFAPLNGLSVLAPRDISHGPQGLPVNQSAVQAGVIDPALDPAYRLVVTGKVRKVLSLSRDEILAMPSRTAGLPITCVEGWSVAAMWKGVTLARILQSAGAGSGASVHVISMQAPGRLYRSSTVNTDEIADPDYLLAYELNGSTLALDHGYPLRLVGPNRPGVMQTKWVARLVVT